MGKNLIVYFSHKGENYVNGAIKNLTKGKTEIVAEMIQQEVGGDLFEIVPLHDYNYDYYKCIDEAKSEKSKNARPEIKECNLNVAEYDTMYVGYPNWWGTCPMCMFTFLEQCDFAGKKIAPFCTHEGSGMGVSEGDIKRVCKGATVLKGLPIHGAEAGNSGRKISSWLNEISKK